MKKEDDILMMYITMKDLGYTGSDDKSSKKRRFFTITLPVLVEEIQYTTFDEFDLEGQGIQKFIIPSQIIDNHTRLESLLGLKLSCHTDTLTDASALVMNYTR